MGGEVGSGPGLWGTEEEVVLQIVRGESHVYAMYLFEFRFRCSKVLEDAIAPMY